MKKQKAVLVLENGKIFEGYGIGKEGSSIGEVVFSTGMTGYLETLTDPSFYGQIVTQTFPLIGNYGVIQNDFESHKSFVKGYIVRELCENPSNFRCQEKLEGFLLSQNVVGLCGIDTRDLTKILRESGTMNGIIIHGTEEVEKVLSILNKNDKESQDYLNKLKEYKIVDAVKSVTCIDKKITNTDCKKTVVLWDFGAKENIRRELEKRNLKVVILPGTASSKEVLDINPDGIMLSNGPGDPSENVTLIEEIKKLCKSNVPIFGICLGHQLLALANGAKTMKLKYGHRGANHPVKNLETKRVYITSQNHGYAVETSVLPANAKLTYVNANDNTCEGLEYTDFNGFSVQFHPEACGGPLDTNFLFDEFVKRIENK